MSGLRQWFEPLSNKLMMLPKEQSASSSRYIGELYQGGIIAALWKESGVEKGLIASLVDLGTSTYSSITGTLIGITAQSQLDGKSNTDAIVLQGDVSGAGYLCENYSNGGYNDWYLPAALELNLISQNKFTINTILGETDGIKYEYYWTSSEYSDIKSSRQNMSGTSGIGISDKTSLSKVRAVRRF